jgi:hypothetical protein
MLKRFEFKASFDVEINEDLLYLDEICSNNRQSLLKEFLKDKNALIDLYKSWFICELQYNEHFDNVRLELNSKDDADILIPIIRKLPKGIKQFFLEILNSDDDEKYAVFEKFFEQFQLLQFREADFREVKNGVGD